MMDQTGLRTPHGVRKKLQNVSPYMAGATGEEATNVGVGLVTGCLMLSEGHIWGK